MKLYTIGVDLGGTNIKAALFDPGFTAIGELSVPTEAARGPAHVLSRIRLSVQLLTEDKGITLRSIACMGLGIPGLLDPEEGMSLFSPNFPGWEHIHIVNEMKPYYDFPVFIDNDVRVNLYGEWQHGAARGYKNVVLLTLGTGLGSGIVNDGRVVYGTTFSAGEIGHMNMFRQGRPCRCGSSGCLGRYVSAVGMVNTFTEKLAEGRPSIIQTWTGGDKERITALMISEAYDLEDALAIEVMHETGVLLGFGLANVINLLNPEAVIIGGGMSAAGERLLRSVRETVAEHALKLSGSRCKILQAELGSRAGTLGAAAYALRRLKGKKVHHEGAE
ncbi:ROK family protein [Paenibacillus jilunlii]|uniref:Glucokinase n=1 Tax=Paenibacillus jilunlii TaxID=682956 RepID=A0A1G9HGJ7_9BACL|nr:ROK family protein [Paenibacillus jilunlii]KWX69666.1 glucokinase [Paenibacillus jilunlii]SDL12017.1 glucokinase [Paenibacillus jilunlii]